MWPLLMAHLADPPSSSISFASSSLLSNGSSAIPALPPPPPSPAAAESAAATLEIVCLSKLSSNLERLLTDTTAEFDLTDADIVVSGDGGKPIGVHRCILAAWSRFFLDLFARGGSAATVARPWYSMEELVPEGPVGREAFMAFLSYLYTGKLRSPPLETVTCVDHMCAHDACRPAVNFAVELIVASSALLIKYTSKT